MALTLTLHFIGQPSPGDVLDYALRVNGVAVSTVVKTFGTDIVIGATPEETALNTFMALVSGAPVAGVAYSLAGDIITLEFEGFGITTVTGGGVIEGVIEAIITEDPGLVPFDLLDLTIEVYDTYDNERPLIEEFTQLNAPKLIWEGGDDLYQPMMPSKFTFNILDEQAGEGRFLHLLTGDEQRFKVKIRNTDAEGVQTLLWQGFLLPDLYSEPYKNGALFVQFTAIDMLATLKGKTFPIWYYYQKFELPKLLGYILKFTGLPQEFYVKPALENVSWGENYAWRKINVYLATFVKDKQQMDMYDLLEKVLTAQGLQIMSFRGKWIIQGITRKAEASGVVEIYRPDGVFKENSTLENTTVAPLFARDLPEMTAITPWKAVNMNFNSESKGNLFDEGIVKMPYYSTAYDYAEDEDDFTVGYSANYMDNWVKVGAAVCVMGNNELPYFYYRRNVTLLASDYNVPEPAAATNYFEARQKPYAVGGRRYELELEVSVTHIHASLQSSEWIEDRLRDGWYNKMVCYQVFLNGNEILSNRPSFPTQAVLQFVKKKNLENLAGFEATYSLKWEFNLPESGNITVRILPPLGKILDYNILNFYVYPQILKINLVGEVEDAESVRAVRDIDFTQEIDADLDFTSTVDDSVENSFGLGLALGAQFAEIYSGPGTYIVQQHTFTVNEIPLPIYLYLERFPITLLLQSLIFRAAQQHSVFLRKADGTEVPYNSIYTKTILGQPYLAGYNGYTADFGGKPKLPKDYKELPHLNVGDTLMIMASLYGVENKNNRALWKIYGFPDESARSYLKTLAYAYHAVRPQTSFSIDTEALALVFPLQLVQFKYLGDRLYTPTRLELNLATGKTQLTMKEALLSELTDITYE